MKTLICTLLLGLCAGFVQAAEKDKSFTIKFSHVVADDTPKGQGALLFKQLVAERLGGRVQVEVYPNSSLYGDANELQALQNGDVQMLAPSLAKFSQYTQQLQVFDLPFLFDDLDSVNRFQKGAKGRQLLSAMEKHNVTGLAYWHNGMKQLAANRALIRPNDAAGLSFRIQPSPVIESQFAQLGAKAVKLPFAETPNALRAGTIQGTENTWSNIHSQHYVEQLPYLTESNHGVLDYMLVSNTQFWYSIPHAIRMELEDIIVEVTYTVNQAAEQQNQNDRQKLLAGGKAQVTALNEAEREAWRGAMRPVWQQYEGEIGADIIRAAERANRSSKSLASY
ncbi:TRAP transporter substrate-binding protein [Pseudomonas sp. BMS12]|uniref:TRAP transporter substrate-binding protein n=1 Tax=Pseudomonas sp. BMS12 TaxID=1796033 RepID=UPI000839E414|nr:TRAP transporter substrate-binding protein [Pseudomonas sp. BMS12]